jgi:hypothetical protein
LVASDFDRTYDVTEFTPQRATENLIAAPSNRVANQCRGRHTLARGSLLKPPLEIPVQSEALRHSWQCITPPDLVIHGSGRSQKRDHMCLGDGHSTPPGPGHGEAVSQAPHICA